ncbi:MAG TPA: HAD hydrolase family protein [Gemmatimonadales bacterium]|nr:HAD hydrolase family protein [Gemmatimonadales bacterium]
MIDPAVARKVRLLGLDVDGVLTDNGLWIGTVGGQRVEFKRFDVQDGLGFSLLRDTGIAVAWVSGRVSDSTAERARELRVTDRVQAKGASKLAPVTELLERHGLGWEALAWVGDDLADVPVLRRAGLPIAVENAIPEVKALARHVTTRPGGHGAVREVIVDLLTARGEYDAALTRYLEARGDTPR